MPEPFTVVVGEDYYSYTASGVLCKMKAVQGKPPIEKPISRVWWEYDVDIAYVGIADAEPAHVFTLSIYLDGKRVRRLRARAGDLATLPKFAEFLDSNCGALPIARNRLMEVDNVSRHRQDHQKEKILQMERFGWGPKAAAGFHAANASIIGGTIYGNGTRPPTPHGSLVVSPPDDRYAHLLDLEDATDDDVECAIIALIDGLADWWPGSSQLLVGAAIMAPFLEYSFAQKMRPYYWIYGTHMTGKSEFLGHLMRLFGSKWGVMDLPGISSTTASTLSNLKHYSGAIAPLDDVRPDLFTSKGEKDKFLAQLHQYSMGRGRERANRDGVTSRARSTQIKGTLLCTSEVHLSDFGGKGQRGALTSRGVILQAERLTLKEREARGKLVRESSKFFSALTARIIQYVQKDDINPRKLTAQTVKKLKADLASRCVPIDLIGRHCDLYRYSLAGLLLLAKYCKARMPDQTEKAATLLMRGYEVAMEALIPQAAEGAGSLDYFKLLDCATQLHVRNHCDMLEIGEHSGNIKAEPTHTKGWVTPSFHFRKPSTSRPVIGFWTTKYVYLFHNAVQMQAEKHLDTAFSCKLALRELSKLEVELPDGSKVCPLVYNQGASPTRRGSRIYAGEFGQITAAIIRRDAFNILAGDWQDHNQETPDDDDVRDPFP